MTKIQWAEAVWNPLVGCSKVSAGCRSCYAIRDAARLARNPNPKIAAAYQCLTQREGGKLNWTGVVRFLPERLTQPLRRRKPTRYFVNSMSDLFHEDVADDWLDRIFAVMALCPEHHFLVLTKRPERARAYLNEPRRMEFILTEMGRISDREQINLDVVRWPLPNVWLAVSAEDQETLEARIGDLLASPAALHWLSLEPLLGAIDMNEIICAQALPESLDWVVAGGESGPGARPCHLNWARSIRDQCRAAGVAFFMKQLSRADSRDFKRFDAFPPDLQIREIPNA